MENNQLQLIDVPKGISTNSIHEFAKKIIDGVTEGFTSPIDVLVSLKGLEKATEIIKEAVMQNAISEFDRIKDGKKNEVRYGNFILAPMTAGAKYDYSNDPIWQSIREEIEIAKKTYILPLEVQIQEREILLKRHVDRAEVEYVVEVNPYTGEEFTRQPPKQTGGKQILKFTLK